MDTFSIEGVATLGTSLKPRTCSKDIANALHVARAGAEGNKSVINGAGRWFPRSPITPRSIKNEPCGVPFAEVLQVFSGGNRP